MLQASKLETKEQQIKTQVPFTLTVKTHQRKKKKSQHIKLNTPERLHRTASSSTFLFLRIKKVSYFVKMKTKFKYYEYSLPSINKFDNVRHEARSSLDGAPLVICSEPLKHKLLQITI